MSTPASPSSCPDWPRESLDKVREEASSFWATLRATRGTSGLVNVAEWVHGQRTLMNPLVYLGTIIAFYDLVFLVVHWLVPPPPHGLPAWVEIARLVVLPYLLLPLVGAVAHAVLGRGARAVPLRATIGVMIYVGGLFILAYLYMLFAAAEWDDHAPAMFFASGIPMLTYSFSSSFRAIHGVANVRTLVAALLSTVVVLAVIFGLELALFHHMSFSLFSKPLLSP